MPKLPRSTSKSNPSWGSFMKSRWTLLVDSNKYRYLECYDYEVIQRTMNSNDVLECSDGLFYLILVSVSRLRGLSRTIVTEYAFHLLASLWLVSQIQAKHAEDEDLEEHFKDNEEYWEVYGSEPCPDAEDQRVYAELWDEIIAQFRALTFNPRKTSRENLPKSEYLSLWHGAEKASLKLIISSFGIIVRNLAKPVLHVSDQDSKDLIECFTSTLRKDFKDRPWNSGNLNPYIFS